ncbi:hypothetical protein [Polyangium spumosum]|uniref:Uncharacterized protein n=1 Tax=Polyangium spumosum TaxID=889282 RepID=A0A6N7PL66_9BACT|nr:hypothetical protein [Polyangium spumosum]MRG92527.1 hypothetical protein [Polyangium spumosum]
MAKKSKLIDNRIQSSAEVVGAATAHRDQVAERLAARAIEVEGPETKATKEVFGIVIDFLASTLRHSAKRLDDAELAVVAERADDVEPRDRRDTRAADLYNRAVRVRSNVLDALGPEALKVYGLDGPTPRTPRDAVSHARKVANLLEKKPFAVTVDGASFDSAAMAAMLHAKAGALDLVIKDLAREDQELADVLGKRESVATVWVDDYQGVADGLTGLWRLSGRKDLSERVRPTSRTLSGDEVASVEAPSEAGAPETGAKNKP